MSNPSFSPRRPNIVMRGAAAEEGPLPLKQPSSPAEPRALRLHLPRPSLAPTKVPPSPPRVSRSQPLPPSPSTGGKAYSMASRLARLNHAQQSRGTRSGISPPSPMDDLLTLSLVASSTPKERLFWSIVWLPELFSGIEVIESVLKKHKRVIVVGNGPIHANLGRDIDAASHRACIVRCNDFRSSTTPQTHGTSCDLQVINCTTEQHNWDILQWLAPQAHVLVAEREAKPSKIANLMAMGRRSGLTMHELAPLARKVAMERTDATRGFLAVALAMRAMRDCSGELHLYGFGGKGHHTDSCNVIGHGVSDECGPLDSPPQSATCIHLDHAHERCSRVQQPRDACLPTQVASVGEAPSLPGRLHVAPRGCDRPHAFIRKLRRKLY